MLGGGSLDAMQKSSISGVCVAKWVELEDRLKTVQLELKNLEDLKQEYLVKMVDTQMDDEKKPLQDNQMMLMQEMGNDLRKLMNPFWAK
jgi:hypothetical protein